MWSEPTVFMAIYLHLLREANPGQQYLSGALLELQRRQFLCLVYVAFTLMVSFKVLLLWRRRRRSTSPLLYQSLWLYNLGHKKWFHALFHWEISVISSQGQPLFLLDEKLSRVITASVVTRIYVFIYLFFCLASYGTNSFRSIRRIWTYRTLANL